MHKDTEHPQLLDLNTVELEETEEMKAKLKEWEAQHQFKRTMDTLFLNKDMRQAKDMMMEFVD